MQFHIFEVVCCSNCTGRTFTFPVDLKSLKLIIFTIITSGKSPFQSNPSYLCMKDESGRAMKERKITELETHRIKQHFKNCLLKDLYASIRDRKR